MNPTNTNDELLPCPHCGRNDTLSHVWASELAGDDWTSENDDSVHVVCDASKPGGPGGCGASGGAGLTVEAAMKAWNRRAALSQPTSEPVAMRRVRAEFAAELDGMDTAELRRRILAQASHIDAFAQCLDGLAAKKGVEGFRDPGAIRRAFIEATAPRINEGSKPQSDDSVVDKPSENAAPPAAVGVTDAMVDEACDTYETNQYSGHVPHSGAMKRAIEAALKARGA